MRIVRVRIQLHFIFQAHIQPIYKHRYPCREYLVLPIFYHSQIARIYIIRQEVWRLVSQLLLIHLIFRGTLIQRVNIWWMEQTCYWIRLYWGMLRRPHKSRPIIRRASQRRPMYKVGLMRWLEGRTGHLIHWMNWQPHWGIMPHFRLQLQIRWLKRRQKRMWIPVLIRCLGFITKRRMRIWVLIRCLRLITKGRMRIWALIRCLLLTYCRRHWLVHIIHGLRLIWVSMGTSITRRRLMEASTAFLGTIQPRM